MARNPRKAVSALLPETIRVAGVTLCPFTVGRLLVLQRLGHPLAADTTSAAMTNEETMQLLFVLSRPAEEAKRLLDDGDDVFSTAVIAFADTIPVTDLVAVGKAVAAQWEKTWETGLKTIPDGQKKTA